MHRFKLTAGPAVPQAVSHLMKIVGRVQADQPEYGGH
jgi:hypothetical protein